MVADFEVFSSLKMQRGWGPESRTSLPSREFYIGHHHDYECRNVWMEVFILHVRCDSVRTGVFFAVSLIPQLPTRVHGIRPQNISVLL
jgi:hypothetical protein